MAFLAPSPFFEYRRSVVSLLHEEMPGVIRKISRSSPHLSFKMSRTFWEEDDDPVSAIQDLIGQRKLIAARFSAKPVESFENGLLYLPVVGTNIHAIARHLFREMEQRELGVTNTWAYVPHISLVRVDPKAATHAAGLVSSRIKLPQNGHRFSQFFLERHEYDRSDIHRTTVTFWDLSARQRSGRV